MTLTIVALRKIRPEQLFMFSALVVNGGNYLYNLILGRWLGPEAFAQAALIITFLLVVAFAGMTFQITAAKYRSEWDGIQWQGFLSWFRKLALVFGSVFGVAMIGFSDTLARWFHFENGMPFIFFGIGIPVYFLLSVIRGRQQGQQAYGALSISYQGEMWTRLLLTMALLVFLPAPHAVALGIAISFLPSVLQRNAEHSGTQARAQMSAEDRNRVIRFMAITAVYECTQILINNGDIVLVTHFFDPSEAGQYASLALIGRVVYFITWMFIMVLLPEVIRQRKSGLDTRPLLMRNVAGIGLFSGAIVIGCFLFPEFGIRLLFGEAYLELAGLLGPYALATALFAMANLFTYYFLSLDFYRPMFLAAAFAVLQISLLYILKPSLATIVWVQVVCMGGLLLAQVLYFLINDPAGKPTEKPAVSRSSTVNPH